jgi:hypothetical protein
MLKLQMRQPIPAQPEGMVCCYNCAAAAEESVRRTCGRGLHSSLVRGALQQQQQQQQTVTLLRRQAKQFHVRAVAGCVRSSGQHVQRL